MSVHLRTVRVKMQSQKNRGKIAIGVQNRGKNTIAPSIILQVSLIPFVAFCDLQQFSIVNCSIQSPSRHVI